MQMTAMSPLAVVATYTLIAYFIGLGFAILIGGPKKAGAYNRWVFSKIRRLIGSVISLAGNTIAGLGQRVAGPKKKKGRRR